MPITYDPDTNTITIVGTKDGQPYCFEDIYQADVNNGWNKFTKLSEGVYKTTAKLQFGDESTLTLFEEKGTTLVIENTASKDYDSVILFNNNCNATFGEYEEVNGVKVVSNGVVFIGYETNFSHALFKHNPNSNVNYYGCSFKVLNGSTDFRLQGFRNELIGCYSEFNINTPIGAIISYLIGCGSSTIITNPQNAIIENVTLLPNSISPLWFYNVSSEIKNAICVVRDYLANVYNLQSPDTIKFINCKSNKWSMRWYLAEGTVSGILQRIYAVRFKVTDVNGNPLANREIKVYDRNGNKIAEAVTDSNGLTDEVEILYAKLTNPYSDGQWHTFDEDDWEYFNPFTIEVYYGNELEYRGVITDLDVESTFIQITVKPSSLTINDLADKIEYVRKLFGNRWKIENNELKIYDDDNQTVIRRFKLYDKEGKPTETNVYDRVPV